MIRCGDNISILSWFVSATLWYVWVFIFNILITIRTNNSNHNVTFTLLLTESFSSKMTLSIWAKCEWEKVRCRNIHCVYHPPRWWEGFKIKTQGSISSVRGSRGTPLRSANLCVRRVSPEGVRVYDCSRIMAQRVLPCTYTIFSYLLTRKIARNKNFAVFYAFVITLPTRGEPHESLCLYRHWDEVFAMNLKKNTNDWTKFFNVNGFLYIKPVRDVEFYLIVFLRTILPATDHKVIDRLS